LLLQVIIIFLPVFQNVDLNIFFTETTSSSYSYRNVRCMPPWRRTSCCTRSVPTCIWTRKYNRLCRKQVAPTFRKGWAPDNGTRRCPDDRWRSAILPSTWSSDTGLRLERSASCYFSFLFYWSRVRKLWPFCGWGCEGTVGFW